MVRVLETPEDNFGRKQRTASPDTSRRHYDTRGRESRKKSEDNTDRREPVAVFLISQTGASKIPAGLGRDAARDNFSGLWEVVNGGLWMEVSDEEQ